MFIYRLEIHFVFIEIALSCEKNNLSEQKLRRAALSCICADLLTVHLTY